MKGHAWVVVLVEKNGFNDDNSDNSDLTNDANDDERISAETTASEGI